MPHRAEISAGTVHCGHAHPWIWEGMGYTVATPCLVFLDEGADFEGGTGRLLGVGFSGSRPLGVGLSWCRLLELGRLRAAGYSSSRPPEGGTSYWCLEGRSQPRCLERFWVSG